MVYKIFNPSSFLKPFIESYVIYEDGGFLKNVELTIVPSGAPEIAIHYGDSVESYLNQSGEIQTGYLYGPHCKPGFFKSSGFSKCLCVNFKPLGVTRVFGIPQIEMRNSAIELDLIFGTKAKRLVEQVCLATSHNEMVEIVDKFLTQLFYRKSEKLTNIAEPLLFIQQSKGTVKIRHMCRKLKINIKTLERNFKQLLGLTPKEYASIVRFNYAYELAAKNPEIDIQNIISQCGYYDQAHLINDVKGYTRLTPQKLFLDSKLHVIHVNRLYTLS